MEVKEYQGKTLDGAIMEACVDLGITSDKLKYDVIQEGTAGFLGLGIGAKKYIIRIRDSRNDAEDTKSSFKSERSSEKKSEGFKKSSNADADAKNAQKNRQFRDNAGQDRKQEQHNKNSADSSNAVNTAAASEGKKSFSRDNANAEAGRRRDNRASAGGSNGNDGRRNSSSSRRDADPSRSRDVNVRNNNAAAGSDSVNADRSDREGRNDSDRSLRKSGRDQERRQRNSQRRDNNSQKASSNKGERKFTHGGYADNLGGSTEYKEKAQRSEDSPRRYEKTGTVTGDPVKTAEEFLTGLFKSMEMNISYKGVFKSENNELVVDLSGEDMGVLIGKRGQTLDALQYLTSQVVNKHETTYVRVKIDTENYRERRRETMEVLAQNIAQKVKRTHKPVALEPMNPYERRIIHSILQNEKDVITRSEGVEPYRHVIVCPVKKKRERNERIGGKSRYTAENAEAEDIKLSVSEEIVQEVSAVNEADGEIIKEQIITEELSINTAAAETDALNVPESTAEDNKAAYSEAAADTISETAAEARDTASSTAEAEGERAE